MKLVRTTPAGFSISPNAFVRVQLTAAGERLLREHFADGKLPEAAIEILHPKCDNGRRFQIGDLMRIYGTEMVHGNPDWPFDGDIQISLSEQPS